MLKIRLQRVGKKNQPSYRVVLVEHTAPPKGKFLEILGSYNPRKKEKNFKKERIEHWISKGVQISPTVHNLLVDAEILKKEKVKAWKPKKSKKEEKPATAETQKPAEVAKEQPLAGSVKVAAPERGEPRLETSGQEAPKTEEAPPTT